MATARSKVAAERGTVPAPQQRRPEGGRTARRKVTYSELRRWPDDGRHYELYDGEVHVVPSPIPFHELARQRLNIFLFHHCEEGTVRLGRVYMAPLDIVFTQFDIIQPDIIFFREDRHRDINLLKPIRIPPDLVIEVLSPSTARTDRGRKMRTCAKYGVPEFWLVDPKKQLIEAYALGESGYDLPGRAEGASPVRSSVLPGLSFPTEAVFQI